MTIIYLDGVDIYPYVVGNSFEVRQERGQYGQPLPNASPTITGIDIDHYWDPTDPASQFFGVTDFSIFKVIIENNGTEVFNGSVEDITINADRTANVQLKSQLQRLLQTDIVYSTASETLNPAMIFMEVCELYKIPYDPISVLNSSAIYELNEIRCTVSIQQPQIKVLEFLDQLAQIGIASIFAIGNTLYYQVYSNAPIEYPAVTVLNSSDQSVYWILTNPVRATVQKDNPAGYAITYYDPTVPSGEQTTTFGDPTNSFSVPGGQGAMIRISTLASATWIGETYLEYLTRPDTSVTLNIGSPLASELQVGWTMELDMADGTVPFRFYITSIILIDDVQSTLTGVGTVNV